MPTKSLRIGHGPQPGKWRGFSREQRGRIEKAYGYPIDVETWEKVEHITSLITYSTPITKTAAPLPLILKKLKKLAGAAKAVQLSILQVTSSDLSQPPKSLAEIYLNYFQHDADKLTLADAYPFLLKVSAGAVALCDFIERERPSDFPEGQFWGWSILMIADTLRKKGLPVSARKDRQKAKTDASPFVAMICALQSELPKECRPQYLTTDAVAQAYHRARLKSG